MAASLFPACGGGDDPSAFEDPGYTVAGATAEEWAARWWQWAFELPADGHPILDGDCTAGQSGDVFFLAGNFGGESNRTCTVPAGKALLFPVVTYLCYPSPENPDEGCATPDTEEELVACALSGFDGQTVTMTLEVDGEVLDDIDAYRAHSAMFSWTVPADPADYLFPGIGPIEANSCGIPEGDRFGVADGFWIALRPLSPGAHTLRFTADVQPADFTIDINYELVQQ